MKTAGITQSLLTIATVACLGGLSTPSLAVGSTGSGLDQIVEIVETDARLQRRVAIEDIATAATAADDMNHIILDAVFATGVGNDHVISTADTRELNDYIFANHHDEWVLLHGDDEDNGEDTGFHLVVNNGNRTKLFGRNAINAVADGIYHLGFETHRRNRLLNEDGNKNKRFGKVGEWLNGLLQTDLEAGALDNPAIVEVIGSTGTGLDVIVDIIYSDERLQKRISTGDMREAAASADAMNHIIIEAIQATGVGQDGDIDKNDARELNEYIVANHQAQWADLHGDDEAGAETGFHLVQGDGAKTRIFGKNALNNVADSIYHLGFATDHPHRLENEDGDLNRSFRKVGLWLSLLLLDDLENGSL